MEYYTYAYLREDKTPYYVGKGSNNRAYKNDGRPCNIPPKNRILILKNGLNEQEAFKHEIYMISVFGRKDLGTGILHNRTAGGDGTSGAVRSDDLRKRISDSMKGRTFSEEHLKKISDTSKGREVSEETRKKISKKLKGKKLPEKTKEKMRNSTKKRWESGEFTGNKGMRWYRETPSNVKNFCLTSPENVVYNISTGLKKFCEEHFISYQTIYYGLHYKNGNATNGWKITYDKKNLHNEIR